jgi:SAM-dependent methyltransferase
LQHSQAPALHIGQIRRWFEAIEASSLPDSVLLETWHSLSHQCRFVKTLQAAASVLDVGAGDGALQIYRKWPAPERLDLKMHAFAMDRGSMFGHYDGYELGAWPEGKPNFCGRRFDAIFAANFIEHIDEPIDFVRWSAGHLSARGRIFLEWPRPESLSLPTATELHAIGIDVMTGNYFDDATHRSELPSTEAVHACLMSAGLKVEAAGTLRVPYFEDHLMAYGKRTDDMVSRTLAYWSFTGWTQFVVAQR